MVRATVLALLALELVAMAVLPSLLPQPLYLRLYLGYETRANAEAVARGDDAFLVYDGATGWRSRPDAAQGSWRVDAAGLRSTRPITAARGTKRRVLFLGNSLTNGGTGVTNEQTISAGVEDDALEAVNAAVMLYSLDQMLLSYDRWKGYAPDVVVVGIGGVAAEGLDNCYVPFRRKEEKNIPLFKPCFRFDGSVPELVPVPPAEDHVAITRDDRVLRQLAAHDPSYPDFRRWQRFGMTPLSAGLGALYDKAMRARVKVAAVAPRHPADDLRRVLMRDFVEARRRERRPVLFVVLPDFNTATTGGWRGRLPDHYGQRVATMREEGLPIVDAREALRAADDLRALYGPDLVHYSAEGNRVIAAALKPEIEACLKEAATGPSGTF